MHSKINSKKAMLFSISMVLIFAFVMTTALILLVKKEKELAGERQIGDYQLELVKAYSQGEKAMHYIDRAAPLAMDEAIIDLADSGGYRDSPCGSAGNTETDGSNAYVVWNDKGKDCHPAKDALKKSLEGYFNMRMYGYLGVYPERNVKMPTSFEITLSEFSNPVITVRAVDELVVGMVREDIYAVSGECGNRIVSVALRELAKNVVETKPNCGPVVNIYIDGPQCELWCADFVSWVYKEAGYPFDVSGYWKIASALGVKEYFEKNEQFIPKGAAEPLPGDVIAFDNSRPGAVNHVGIVERADEDRVYTIEGNSNNRVKRNSYSLSYHQIVGYGRLKDCETVTG